MHDRTFELGDGRVDVERRGQLPTLHGTAQDVLERGAPGGDEVVAQGVEHRIVDRPLVERGEDVRERAARERVVERGEVGDQPGPEVRVLGRRRCLRERQRGVEQRAPIRPVPVQGAPTDTRLGGDVGVGHAVDAVAHEQHLGGAQRSLLRSCGAGIHRGKCGTSCATVALWHILCHMTDRLLDPAITFFRDLEADNTTHFWERRRADYEAIRAGFVAVCDRLDDLGPWRVYRPHNDRRFQPDRAPYKTFLGAVTEGSDGVGIFLQVGRRGVLVGTGMPMPARDQLPRLRDAIADERTGPALVEAIRRATARGVDVHGGRWPPLARTPRGYPTGTARDELLRWKGVEANVRVERPAWRTVDEAATALRELVGRPIELNEWLGRCVGPSEMTPEERFAPRRRAAGA